MNEFGCIFLSNSSSHIHLFFIYFIFLFYFMHMTMNEFSDIFLSNSFTVQFLVILKQYFYTVCTYYNILL